MSPLSFKLNSVDYLYMKKRIMIHFATFIACLSFNQAINAKRNLVLRFTGPAQQNSHTMTRYYTEPKQLIDLWKNRMPLKSLIQSRHLMDRRLEVVIYRINQFFVTEMYLV